MSMLDNLKIRTNENATRRRNLWNVKNKNNCDETTMQQQNEELQNGIPCVSDSPVTYNTSSRKDLYCIELSLNTSQSSWVLGAFSKHTLTACETTYKSHKCWLKNQNNSSKHNTRNKHKTLINLNFKENKKKDFISINLERAPRLADNLCTNLQLYQFSTWEGQSPINISHWPKNSSNSCT